MPSMTTTPDAPAQVLIAGAGIAGIEAALALRAFAGPAAHVRLIDPSHRFRIPATSTGRAFGVGSDIDHPLADVAARAGATLTQARLAAVDPERHMAMLSGGQLLTYDALIVAVGAKAEPSVGGALIFRGHDDSDSVRGMVDEIARAASRGAATRLAIVVPAGCAWPLAAYELALMAREHLTAAGNGDVVEVAIVTAEDRPLGLFGSEASASVERTLGRAGIEVHAGAVVRGWQWGRLDIAGRGSAHGGSRDRPAGAAGPLRGGAPVGRARLRAHGRGLLGHGGGGRLGGGRRIQLPGQAGRDRLPAGGRGGGRDRPAARDRDGGAALHPKLRGWVWDGDGGSSCGRTFPEAEPRASAWPRTRPCGGRSRRWPGASWRPSFRAGRRRRPWPTFRARRFCPDEHGRRRRGAGCVPSWTRQP